MKIAILTYWWSQDNYGQLLQCYALQQYLKNLGHDAYVIRYCYNKDMTYPLSKKIFLVFNIRFMMNYIKRKKSNKKNKHINDDRSFDEFRKKNISFSDKYYSTYEELKKSPPSADLYIVGSDQVWHFNSELRRIKKILHAYLLDFGNSNTLRISYAASWGVDCISKEIRDEISPLLSKFHFISVREKKGIELCEQCGVENSKWVVDPTLLLSTDDYRKLYLSEIKKERLPENEYIFVYILNNSINFDIKKIYEFANQKQLEVVFVEGNGGNEERSHFQASIYEWLYLIDNAKYVITNSFHCALFSSLFEKNYGVIKLANGFEGMNNRMDSLFEVFKIEPRYIDENFDVFRKEYIPKYDMDITLNKVLMELEGIKNNG